MSDLLFSINVVLPVFLLVILGFILRRIGIFTDAFLATANKFCFLVPFSALMFYNIYSTDWSNVSGGKLALFAAIGILLSVGILLVIVPLAVKDNARRSVIIQGIFRGNYLLFGIPLTINLFGGITGAASVLVAVSIPMFNVLAVTVLTIFAPNSENKRLNVLGILRGIVTNPLIIGCLVGAVFVLLQIKLPNALLAAVEDVSSIATPLALLVLGGQFQVTSLKRNAFALSAVNIARLMILPAVMIGCAVLIGFRGEELGAIAVLFSAPTAVSSQIMAYNMKADAELAGQVVVTTTALSSVTIFLIIFVLKSTGLI